MSTHDILTIKSREKTLEIAGSRIASVRHKDITRKGARVFGDGAIRSASFVGNISDEQLISTASQAAGSAVPYDYDLPGEKSFSWEGEGNTADHFDRLSSETQSALERLRRSHGNFIYNGKSSARHITAAISSSYGINHKITFDLITCSVLYKHNKSGNILDGYFQAVGIGESELADAIDRHTPFLEAYENKVELSSGRRTVIIPEAQNLILNKLCESLRIDRYEQGSALFSGCKGEKLFNDGFSIYDVTFAPEVGIVDPFDGEGIVRDNHRLPLIEKGVFKNVICDLRNGKRFNTSSTGNGSRNFDSGVVLAYNDLVIGHGPRSYADLCKEYGECIYCAVASGGDTADDGSFSCPINLAFLIRDGKVVGRLPQLTIKANIKDLFGKDFLATSSDGLRKLSANPYFFGSMEVFVN